MDKNVYCPKCNKTTKQMVQLGTHSVHCYSCGLKMSERPGEHKPEAMSKQIKEYKKNDSIMA